MNFDSNHASVEKNMDDLILKAAIWQDDHWFDRSALLKAEPVVLTDVVTVELGSKLYVAFFFFVLIPSESCHFFFWVVPLKARSSQLPAAGEKDLAALLASAPR